MPTNRTLGVVVVHLACLGLIGCAAPPTEAPQAGAPPTEAPQAEASPVSRGGAPLTAPILTVATDGTPLETFATPAQWDTATTLDGMGAPAQWANGQVTLPLAGQGRVPAVLPQALNAPALSVAGGETLHVGGVQVYSSIDVAPGGRVVCDADTTLIAWGDATIAGVVTAEGAAGQAGRPGAPGAPGGSGRWYSRDGAPGGNGTFGGPGGNAPGITLMAAGRLVLTATGVVQSVGGAGGPGGNGGAGGQGESGGARGPAGAGGPGGDGGSAGAVALIGYRGLEIAGVAQSVPGAAGMGGGGWPDGYAGQPGWGQDLVLSAPELQLLGGSLTGTPIHQNGMIVSGRGGAPTVTGRVVSGLAFAATSGYVLSRPYDMGGPSQKTTVTYHGFTPTMTTPAGTAITFGFQDSDDGVHWNGFWQSDVKPLTKRYLRFAARLTSTSAAVSPSLTGITVDFD